MIDIVERLRETLDGVRCGMPPPVISHCETLLAAKIEIERLRAENAKLRAALKDVLPLAEQYLWDAPSHPDNAKIETVRTLATHDTES